MEEILEPNLKICDPHHHLWDRPGNRYMVEELRADVNSGHRIEKTMFVECMERYRETGPEAFQPVGETEFVAATDTGGLISGIVGRADLRVPEIEDVLAAHVEAGKGLFRGIRQSAVWDASPEVPSRRPNPPQLLADPALRSGVGAIGRAGLSFETYIFHPQIPELTDLARAYPDVPMVLNHLGGPLGVGPYKGHHDEVIKNWRAALTELSTCPNAVMKLGGVGMPIFGGHWIDQEGGATSEQIDEVWGDDIRFCIEQFGADRCMFESNFPVDSASFSYAVCWNAFKRIAAHASPAEKEQLFYGTAVRTYKL